MFSLESKDLLETQREQIQNEARCQLQLLQSQMTKVVFTEMQTLRQQFEEQRQSLLGIGEILKVQLGKELKEQLQVMRQAEGQDLAQSLTEFENR